jgi:protein-S-isoprenylcysteine O-methyltransferase Ste14
MVLITGFNRILAYAILIPLFFIVGFGLRFLSPEMIMAAGVILMVVGTWMLAKFLRTHPIQVEEEDLV